MKDTGTVKAVILKKLVGILMFQGKYKARQKAEFLHVLDSGRPCAYLTILFHPFNSIYTIILTPLPARGMQVAAC